jgi:hypothetical protein
MMSERLKLVLFLGLCLLMAIVLVVFDDPLRGLHLEFSSFAPGR